MTHHDRSQPPGAGAVFSSLSGTARDVVQARSISGGVHFHTTAPPDAVVPRQLPADPHGFVGRRAELAQLHAAADGNGGQGPGVVVVTGTAGVGKSALAVRFAHQVAGRFGGGHLFVNMRGYDQGRPLDPAGVLARFLRALGADVEQIGDELEERAEAYRSLLADRRVLVVLDNAADAGHVRPLLPGGRGCLVVVTSRSRLSGLVAREGARRLPVRLLPEADAVALIRSATSGYRDDESGALAELARLCARLPLALRIAAERAAARPLMPLGELNAQLRRESSLWQALSSESETGSDAVAAVFGWSYRALPQTAARAFRLLGVFPGRQVSVGCAGALLNESVERTAGVLDVLAGAHLIEQVGPSSYQFHDLLRAYAADRARDLEDDAERSAALARVLQWYLYSVDAASQAIETLRPSVLDGPSDVSASVQPVGDRTEAVAWYRAEHANLPPLVRAAHRSGLDREVWQLAVALGPLNAMAGTMDEWRETAQIALASARRLGDRRAQALVQLTLASAYEVTGHADKAMEALAAAEPVFAHIQDQAAMIDTANRLGLLHLATRDLPRAQDCFTRVLRLAQAAHLDQWQGLAWENLATVAATAGHTERAVDHAERALACYARAEIDPHRRVGPMVVLARAHRAAGRLPQAAHFTQAAAILDTAVGSRWIAYYVHGEQAAQALAEHRGEKALEEYWQCARLARTLGSRMHEAQSLAAIGTALLALGRAQEAADFAHTAATLTRRHATAFDTAHALATLADAQNADGSLDQAATTRVEAGIVLSTAGYTDPAATALQARLNAHQPQS